MKIRIGNTITDISREPMMLIFSNDEERKQLIKNLVYMEDRPGKVRKYYAGPSSLSMEEVRQFMNIENYEKI